eukprot:214140-Hanusia_phi.AAC.1
MINPARAGHGKPLITFSDLIKSRRFNGPAAGAGRRGAELDFSGLRRRSSPLGVTWHRGTESSLQASRQFKLRFSTPGSVLSLSLLRLR